MQFVDPSHPILSVVADEVKPGDILTPPVQQLIDHLLAVAGVERGNPNKSVLVGLAAPQVGIPVRIILVDTGANGKGGISTIRVYINPKIIHASEDQTEWYEACYSTGPVAGIVSRPRIITVEALNEKGEKVVETHSDYVARIFQHEIDHLNGKRFPAHISDPSKLHLVGKDEMPLYRNQEGWRNWPKKCPFPEWERIRNGL